MKPITFVVGPTASGKSEYAINLAKKYHAEIINADSQQIYQELEIGTNKIIDQQGIKHYLLNSQYLDFQ